MKDTFHLFAQKPPEFLFCAVKEDLVDDTFEFGLKRKWMPFIVMSENSIDACRRIPQKKHPYAFVVMARLMCEDGYTFSKAETGEWIIDIDVIPPKYLRLQ